MSVRLKLVCVCDVNHSPADRTRRVCLFASAERHSLLSMCGAHGAGLCSQAVVPLSLQEARKTVTAGAAFRPFPGDDWQAFGELLLFGNTPTYVHAASMQHHMLHAT